MAYFSFRRRDLYKGKEQEVVLLKSNREATYHLASVIDDYLLKVTDIVRSNDHLDNSFVHNECFLDLN